jgi:hypothetical protein
LFLTVSVLGLAMARMSSVTLQTETVAAQFILLVVKRPVNFLP